MTHANPPTDQPIASAALALYERVNAILMEEIYGLYDYEEGKKRLVAAVQSALDAHAQQLQRRCDAAEKERDEAIAVHGYFWNAVRAAAQTFRWLGIPADAHKECGEDASRVYAAEKLPPKWSTDWAVIPRHELETLQAKLTEAEKDAVRLRDTVVKVESLLTNLQPHIPQACYPKHAAYIDNYVDPALESLRSAIARDAAGTT
jgi:hypothetical protein